MSTVVETSTAPQTSPDTAGETAVGTHAGEAASAGDTGQPPPGRASPATVFAVALALGSLTAVVEGRNAHHELPVRDWAGHASRSDRFLLDHEVVEWVELPYWLAAETSPGAEVTSMSSSPMRSASRPS